MKTFENLHAPMCPWYEYSEQYGAPMVNWCEESLCTWVSEPANTWSNLGYILFALVAFILARKAKSPRELTLLAINIFIMGVLSLMFHASNIFPTQVLDFIGMFLYVFLILSWNLWRAHFLSLKKRRIFFFMTTLCSTLLCYLLYFVQINMQFIVVAAAIGIIITEYWARTKGSIPKNKYYFTISILLLGIAQLFSQLDLHRIWCEPHNHHIFAQGHSLWHLISSVGIFFSFLHYTQIKLTK